jgi:hypothetical protein
LVGDAGERGGRERKYGAGDCGVGFYPRGGGDVEWRGADDYVCGFVGFNGGDSGVRFESERDGDVDGEQSGVVSLEFDSIHYQLKKLGGAAKGDAAGAAFLRHKTRAYC